MSPSGNGLRILQRIASERPKPVVGERCDMCAVPIADAHQHVVNVQDRQLMCVCRGCYLLFTDESAELRFRAVPERYLSFPDFELAPGRWDELDSSSFGSMHSARPSSTTLRTPYGRLAISVSR